MTTPREGGPPTACPTLQRQGSAPVHPSITPPLPNFGWSESGLFGSHVSQEPVKRPAPTGVAPASLTGLPVTKQEEVGETKRPARPAGPRWIGGLNGDSMCGGTDTQQHAISLDAKVRPKHTTVPDISDMELDITEAAAQIRYLEFVGPATFLAQQQELQRAGEQQAALQAQAADRLPGAQLHVQQVEASAKERQPRAECQVQQAQQAKARTAAAEAQTGCAIDREQRACAERGEARAASARAGAAMTEQHRAAVRPQEGPRAAAARMQEQRAAVAYINIRADEGRSRSWAATGPRLGGREVVDGQPVQIGRDPDVAGESPGDSPMVTARSVVNRFEALSSPRVDSRATSSRRSQSTRSLRSTAKDSKPRRQQKSRSPATAKVKPKQGTVPDISDMELDIVEAAVQTKHFEAVDPTVFADAIAMDARDSAMASQMSAARGFAKTALQEKDDQQRELVAALKDRDTRALQTQTLTGGEII